MSLRSIEPRLPGTVPSARRSRRFAPICAAVLLLAAMPLAAQTTDTTAQKSGARTPAPGTTLRTDTTLPKTGTTQPGSSTSPPKTADSTRRRDDSLRIAALQDSLKVAQARLAKPGGWGEFPGSAATAVLAIILLGALGALAGDLVADGGRLDRWKRDDTGWLLGFPGRLLIGVVTALIVVLGLNPPGGSWPVLMSTALAVGAASEAVLLSVMASWKARMAEQEKERVANVAVTTLQGAREDVRAVTTTAGAGGGVAKSFDASPETAVAEQVDRILARAQATILVESGERRNP
jgi:hypothetical protein